MKTDCAAGWEVPVFICLVMLCLVAGPAAAAAADTETAERGSQQAAPAVCPGAQEWCVLAQQKVAGLSEKALPHDKIAVTLQTGKEGFLKSKPAIAGGTIAIHAYEPAPAERGSGFAEFWCKLKSRDAIADAGLAGQPQSEPGTCMALNEAAVAWALKNAPRHDHGHAEPAAHITFLPDQEYLRGDTWVGSSVRIVPTGDGKIAVQASVLRTPGWIPWLGGNQYCKALSPRGAAQLVDCLAGHCDPELVKAGEPYAVPEADGMYTEGKRYSAVVGDDSLDLYLPNAGGGTPFAAVILLQGAKCDKQYYSMFAKLVASYGFVVAVANHTSLLGKNFTDQAVVNRVWQYVQGESRSPRSPLYRRVLADRFALMGHSYGGIACLNVMQAGCRLPTCFGFSYEAPKELAAVVLYGTNTKSPMTGAFQQVDTRGIPVLYVNGDRDGKALLTDTLITFRDKTTGGPKALATVHGANHYGIADQNNPPGGEADPSAPALQQHEALASIARVSSIFLLAHVYREPGARSYIDKGEGNIDPAVSIQSQ